MDDWVEPAAYCKTRARRINPLPQRASAATRLIPLHELRTIVVPPEDTPVAAIPLSTACRARLHPAVPSGHAYDWATSPGDLLVTAHGPSGSSG